MKQVSPQAQSFPPPLNVSLHLEARNPGLEAHRRAPSPLPSERKNISDILTSYNIASQIWVDPNALPLLFMENPRPPVGPINLISPGRFPGVAQPRALADDPLWLRAVSRNFDPRPSPTKRDLRNGPFTLPFA